MVKEASLDLQAAARSQAPFAHLGLEMALLKKGSYQETKGFELGQGPKLPWPTLAWKWLEVAPLTWRPYQKTKGFELGQGPKPPLAHLGSEMPPF